MPLDGDHKTERFMHITTGSDPLAFDVNVTLTPCEANT